MLRSLRRSFAAARTLSSQWSTEEPTSSQAWLVSCLTVATSCWAFAFPAATAALRSARSASSCSRLLSLAEATKSSVFFARAARSVNCSERGFIGGSSWFVGFVCGQRPRSRWRVEWSTAVSFVESRERVHRVRGPRMRRRLPSIARCRIRLYTDRRGRTMDAPPSATPLAGIPQPRRWCPCTREPGSCEASAGSSQRSRSRRAGRGLGSCNDNGSAFRPRSTRMRRTARLMTMMSSTITLTRTTINAVIMSRGCRSSARAESRVLVFPLGFRCGFRRAEGLRRTVSGRGQDVVEGVRGFAGQYLGLPSARRGVVASRPVRRILSRRLRSVERLAPEAAIPLGRRLPAGSSGLPGGVYGRAVLPLSGLAPGGVCRAARVAPGAGALLPHRFTLTCARPLRRPVPPSAVCSLWHFPAGRPDWVLPSTVPGGVRTFLGPGRRSVRHAAARPTRHHLYCRAESGELPPVSRVAPFRREAR